MDEQARSANIFSTNILTTELEETVFLCYSIYRINSSNQFIEINLSKRYKIKNLLGKLPIAGQTKQNRFYCKALNILSTNILSTG